MMTRCANCETPLVREKDVGDIQKISWLNWEFNCPHCGVRLSTSCLWHEVLSVSAVFTHTLLVIFMAMELFGNSSEPFSWVRLITIVVLISVMVFSMQKLRTRVLAPLN